MNELSKLLQENLNIEFISATLSNPKNKDGVQKVKVRPILKKMSFIFSSSHSRIIRRFTRMGRRKKLVKYFLSIWKICARCRWRHKEQLIQFL